MINKNIKKNIDTSVLHNKLFNKLPYKIPHYLWCIIFSYIYDTKTYANVRATCKLFYKILVHFKIYNYGVVDRIIYYKNHNPVKIEKYCYSFLNKKYIPVHITHFENLLQNGPVFRYNIDGSIYSKYFYKNNKINGLFIKYEDNKVIQKTNYKNSYKHGNEYLRNNITYIYYDKQYNYGILTFIKKYNRSKIVYECNFKNNQLNGLSYIYNRNKTKKNILNFKNSKLNGYVMLTQYDRIIKCMYTDGYLDGPQIVFNKENKIKFIGNYNKGKLYGRYLIYKGNRKQEEGYINQNGYYEKCIIYNTNELMSIEYPFSNGYLNGIYRENINFFQIKIGFENNNFNGFYSINDSANSELTELKIYNDNNFEFTKYKNKNKIIIFKKILGEYTLQILNQLTSTYNFYELDMSSQYSSITY